jgi:hypothetical protein
LNAGYGFRRDQLVIYNIRQKYMQHRYENVFGKASFDPRNKTLSDFLPEFSRSFFTGILTLQILLFASFKYAIAQFICYPPFCWFNIIVTNLIFLIPLL